MAEDNKVNQKLAVRVLSKLGYVPDLAENGAEALAAARAKDFDLILMDVQMPEMDGLEATRRIRRLGDTAGGGRPGHRPIIVAMTANTMTGDREDCLAAGMDDFLPKPVKPIELMRMLIQWGASLARTRGHERAA